VIQAQARQAQSYKNETTLSSRLLTLIRRQLLIPFLYSLLVRLAVWPVTVFHLSMTPVAMFLCDTLMRSFLPFDT